MYQNSRKGKTEYPICPTLQIAYKYECNGGVFLTQFFGIEYVPENTQTGNCLGLDF